MLVPRASGRLEALGADHDVGEVDGEGEGDRQQDEQTHLADLLARPHDAVAELEESEEEGEEEEDERDHGGV